MKFDTTGLEDYLTDKDLESDVGVWIVFPGDRKFNIRRAGGSNAAFARAFQAAVKPYDHLVKKGTLDRALGDKIMYKVYADTVVRDWSGIYDIEGEEIPYSPEAAVEYFTLLPDLFAELMGHANDMATFSITQLEQAKDVLGKG